MNVTRRKFLIALISDVGNYLMIDKIIYITLPCSYCDGRDVMTSISKVFQGNLL